MTGWQVMPYRPIRMREAVVWLALSASSAVNTAEATEQLPDAELLEFLGYWADDTGWLDEAIADDEQGERDDTNKVDEHDASSD